MDMKRVFFMLAMALILCSASSAIAEETAVKASNEEAALKVAGIEGKVFVKIAPSAEWTNAAVGQAVNRKDAVKTGDDGQARLEFSDKSSLAMKPNTEISVDELVWTAAAKKAGLSMSAGELRAVIQKIDTPSDFRVKTPTAICGARGTVFYLIVTESGTRVFVTDGAVDFSNAEGGNSYVVVQNMAAIADVSGAVTEPRELTGPEKDQVLAGWSGIIAETYTEAPAESREKTDTSETPVIQENPAQENKGQNDNPVSPI